MATKGKSVKRPASASQPIPETVHKHYVCDETKAVNDAERTIRFRISTDAVDREKDIVDPRGWHTDEFMKNPVVLFGHDYKSLPVARALSLSADEHGLSMVAQFPPAEVYPFADTVYQMVKAGFLNATSVGFKPMRWDLEPERGGVRYHEQTLLEASIVPIPANPQALVEARSLGMETDQLRTWAETVLKMLDPSESIIDSPGESVAPAVEPPALPTLVLETKTGRVLSGRNESALRDSLAALNAAMTQLQTVLAQAGTGQDEDEDETPAKPEDEPKAAEALQPVITITDAAEVTVEKEMVVFRLVDDPDPRFVFEPAMVSEVIARGYVTTLAAVVDARVGAALSALRGRID
jgi:HK97 family phage prohead protease